LTGGSRTISRRALLGAGLAGGAALVAGCGADEAPAAPASEVLARQLAAAQGVVAAYGSLSTPAEVPALARRARGREQQLESAVSAAGGTPPAASSAAAAPSVERALAAQRAALAAHVAAIGAIRAPATLELLTGLVVDSAADEAALAALLGRDPLANPFPGEPA
jgi:hypothetical protein